MTDFTLINIGELLQVEESPHLLRGEDLATLPSIKDAYLEVSNGIITGYGKMSQMKGNPVNPKDVSGRLVFPAFVDSHTHLVFAQPREQEFVQKIKGATYQEIAASGGGILNSARRLQEMSEDELFDRSLVRAHQIMHQGTGTVEIKSGYGLTTQDELKMLRVAKRISDNTPLTVKTTFLGAHAVPKDTSKESYIDLVINEMIPRVAEENLATFIDIFCEEGFFTEEESVKILEKGKEYGLIPKVHANQLSLSGGTQAGIATNAISVDHLETISDVEIDLLKNSDTIGTTLPGAAFYLRVSYPPARQLINSNVAVAVASDFNPGSSPTGNMQTIWSLATIGMKMTPVEALNGMTVNGAFAMEAEGESGVIKTGRKADLIISKKVPSLEYIPYSFGEDCIEQVILNGEFIRE